MKLADFNIRATPPQRTKRVEHDLELALSLGLWVYCWQELGKFRRYIKALKRVFDDERWTHLFERKRNIITVRSGRYSVAVTISRQLSKARKRLPQPKRLANAALLRDRRTGALEWVVNFHLTNGAWNRRWFPKWIKKARQRKWLHEVERLKVLIVDLQEIADVPIYLCADSNSKRMPILADKQVALVSSAPMHVSVINPEGNIGSRVIHKSRLNTDHDGLVVE